MNDTIWSAQLQWTQFYSPMYRRTRFQEPMWLDPWARSNTEIDSSRCCYCTTSDGTQSECQASPNVWIKRMNKNKGIASRLVWNKAISHLINYEKMPNGPFVVSNMFRAMALFALALNYRVTVREIIFNNENVTGGFINSMRMPL